MSQKKVFLAALTITLAVILCVGGAILLHQNTKAPEEYAGGTTEINFDEGSAHIAGDAVLIPASEAAESAEAATAIDTDFATDSEKLAVANENDKESNSVTMLNERPENVWAQEETLSTGGYTTRTELPAADSIGTLQIPSIGLTVNAYDSANTMEDMDKGISHFQSTSYWDGNVGFSGHNGNRAYSFFGKLHNVKIGDAITYETQLGTRSYVVTNVWTIDDDDWSHLERTDDNRLTLITCVSDPAKRLCVQAVEQ